MNIKKALFCIDMMFKYIVNSNAPLIFDRIIDLYGLRRHFLNRIKGKRQIYITWITKPFIQFIGFKFRNTNTFEMTPFITVITCYTIMIFINNWTLTFFTKPVCIN
ncbi:hypothetical protein BpHYR1_029386 [Brachionus plicatilis]|uniref:Uncharacterized protein n=1 Tax=Brachionus plicatilis TaxID=10195 RepID=A0A3M7Q5A4_BRAPC|nr:hypothetical protein BpHYR1_029386 [Brachionus plicatilis]